MMSSQTTGIRKDKHLHQLTVQRRVRHEQRDQKWEELYAKRQYEAQRRENEDSMKHASVRRRVTIIVVTIG